MAGYRIIKDQSARVPDILTTAAILMRFKTQVGIVVAAAIAGSHLLVNASVCSARADTPFNTVREIREALRACWISPTDMRAMQVTVRLSFKKNGEVLGQPLITYESEDASEDERTALRAAVAADLALCAPLPLSEALGGIIAGHPINVRLGEGWKRSGKRERR